MNFYEKLEKTRSKFADGEHNKFTLQNFIEMDKINSSKLSKINDIEDEEIQLEEDLLIIALNRNINRRPDLRRIAVCVKRERNKLGEEFEEYNVWRTFTRGNILRKSGDKTLYLVEKATKEYLFVVTNTGERQIFSTKENFRRPQGNNFSQSTLSQQSKIIFLEKNTDSEYNANTNPERNFYISWAESQNEKSVEKKIIHDEEILICIKNREINDKVLEYLYYLTGEEICQCLADNLEGFIDALFMLSVTYGDEFGMEIVNKIEDTYQTFNPKISDAGDYWDNYALFSYYVLRYADNKKVRSFMLDAAARMLKYVAVNKDSKVAKKHIESLKECVNWKYIVGVFE